MSIEEAIIEKPAEKWSLLPRRCRTDLPNLTWGEVFSRYRMSRDGPLLLPTRLLDLSDRTPLASFRNVGPVG